MTPQFYILDNKRVVPAKDALEWAAWLQNASQTGERVVKCEFVAENVQVSTVFIGIDHSLGQGKRLLFETMVFGGPLDYYQVRYATWAGAEFGHDLVVEKVKIALQGHTPEQQS